MNYMVHVHVAATYKCELHLHMEPAGDTKHSTHMNILKRDLRVCLYHQNMQGSMEWFGDGVGEWGWGGGHGMKKNGLTQNNIQIA